MELDSVRIGSVPHARVELTEGTDPLYSAVIVPVDTHMVVSSSIAFEGAAYLVGIYLVLAAAEVTGLGSAARARLLAESQLLLQEGEQTKEHKKNDLPQSDKPL